MDPRRRELQNRSNRVKNGLILMILRPILRQASFFDESKESNIENRIERIFRKKIEKNRNLVNSMDEFSRRRDFVDKI